MTCDSGEEGFVANELLLKQSGKQHDHLRRKLILDTGSTIEATIMNEDMLTNIRTSDKPLVMATNAGVKIMDLDGDLKGIGPAKLSLIHI